VSPSSATPQHHVLKGGVTLVGIGGITLQDIANFETVIENYTTNYYLMQTDGVVTIGSVSIEITNPNELISAQGSSATIRFKEFITYRTTNASQSYVLVAFIQPILLNKRAFLEAIKGSGGTFGQVTGFSTQFIGIQ
jgi:hypothetical protein